MEKGICRRTAYQRKSLHGMRTALRQWRCIDDLQCSGLYIAALVVVLLVYFKGNSNWDYVYMVGAVAAAFVLCRLFDAFFGPLVKPIRNDVLS